MPISTHLTRNGSPTLLDRVAEFGRQQVDPFCEQWEKDEWLPREIFSKAGELGLMGLIAPVEWDGLGLDFVTYIQIIEQLATHYAALALDIAAHNSLCIGHILAFGSESQKQLRIPALARGECLGAWALTEPQAGSDTAALVTNAVEANSGWELTGLKTFITQGRRADLLVVMGRPGMNAKGSAEISD